MPRLPRIELTPEVQGAVGTARASGEVAGSSLQKSIGQLGAAIETLGLQALSARRVSQANKGLADAQKELGEFTLGMQEGGLVQDEEGNFLPASDPTTHKDLYENKVKAIRDRFQDQLDGPSFDRFSANFDSYTARNSLTVQKTAIGKMQQLTRAETQETVDSLADTYVEAPDLEKPTIEKQMNEAIDTAQLSGAFTPEEAVRRKNQWNESVDLAGYRKMVRQDPDSAIIALQTNEFDAFSPHKKEKLIDAAINQGERNDAREFAQNDRKRRELDREQNRREEETAKKAYTLRDEGTLTTEWVKENSRNLTAPTYKSLLDITSGRADVKSDASVALNLRLKADRGVDVSGEVSREVSNGRLSYDDASSILNKTKQSSIAYQQKNWPQENEDFITISLKPSELNPVLDKGIFAKSLRDWRDWVSQNPNATREEARKEADAIVEAGSIVNKQSTTLGIPSPRFLVGTRQKPEIAETWKKTQEAYKNKKIDRATYRREAIRIKKWKRVTDLQKQKRRSKEVQGTD